MQSSAFLDKRYAAFIEAQAAAVSATDRYREGSGDASTALDATERAVRQLKHWLALPADQPPAQPGQN